MAITTRTPPILSVVVLTLNSVKFIQECLESVFATEGIGLEVLVVDGGSTDGTLDVVRRFSARLVVSPGSSIASARNLGIRESTGQYILFVDSDDRIVGGNLAKLIETLHGRIPPFVICAYNWVDHTGAFVEMKLPRKPDRLGDLLENPAGLISVVCKKEILLAIGGFVEEFSVAEDYDLWLRLFEREEGICFPFPIGDHRFHEGSATHSDLRRMIVFAMLASARASERRRVPIFVSLLVVAYWLIRLVLFPSFQLRGSPLGRRKAWAVLKGALSQVGRYRI